MAPPLVGSWTPAPASTAQRSAVMSRVAAGSGGLLAVGRPTGVAAGGMAAWTSADGAPWSRIDTPDASAGESAIGVQGDRFVVVGQIGAVDARRSTAWTFIGSPLVDAHAIEGMLLPPFGAAVARFGVVALAYTEPMGGVPTHAWSSADLVTWRRATLGSTGFAQGAGVVARSDGSAVVFGRWADQSWDVTVRPAGRAAFWTSSDGRTWTMLPAAAALDAVVVRAMAELPGGTLLAVGERWDPNAAPDSPYTTAAWWSRDGTSWTPAGGIPDTTDWKDMRIVVGQGYALLLATPSGSQKPAITAWTRDGTAWIAVEPPGRPSSGCLWDAVPLGDRLIGVGSTATDCEMPPDQLGAGVDAAVWTIGVSP